MIESRLGHMWLPIQCVQGLQGAAIIEFLAARFDPLHEGRSFFGVADLDEGI